MSHQGTDIVKKDESVSRFEELTEGALITNDRRGKSVVCSGFLNIGTSILLFIAH